MKTIELENGKLVIKYDFIGYHIKTLFKIWSNEGCAEFENREPGIEDIDELGLDWKVCDQLVDMGILQEDEESFTIYYELTNEGKEFFENNIDVFRKAYSVLT
ncbi:MAG: hypothetical protein ACOCV1_07290 [Bacillota bacterium]